MLDDLKARYPADKLLVLKLDVTSAQDIHDAFKKAKETFGRIDVVFNNAGYAAFGEVEASSDESDRKLFDTNYWGAINVSREAVKYFRENTPAGGMLIVTSSVLGLAPLPGISSYGASKHGQQAYLLR